VSAGLLGVTASAVEWLQRRQIAHFDASRIAVASLFNPAALFAYAMASALHERAKRLVWLLVAAVILALLFVILALLFVILALLFSTRTRTTLTSSSYHSRSRCSYDGSA
jgi:heme/copper-type cytochrome/quinol oxidase subunit 3